MHNDNLRETLLDIHRFAPKGAAADMIRQAADLVADINSHRPLSEDTVRRLNTEILSDRVHSSAVTEGNRLSKRETIVVLSSGIIEAGARRDVVEVRNLAAATIELDKYLNSGGELTAVDIRSLHSLLLKDLDDQAAGAFRREDVAISGAKVQPPSFQDVPDLVASVLSSPFLNNPTIDPIQRATWAHWAIARIHPFKDGNGRMARLVQDYVLLHSGYVPAALQPEDREGGYYTSLEAADLGDGRPILEVVTKNVLRMSDRYLSIFREQEAGQDWVAKITQAATQRVKQSDHRRFLAVQRASSLIKEEFQKLALSLNDSLASVEIRFRDYGNLEIDKFQELEAKRTSKRTWLFGLDFRVEDLTIRYIFWYGAHRRRQSDVAANLPSDVVLLISAEEHDYFRLLDDLGESRVSLREVVPNGNLYWRRRFDPVTRTDDWDVDITAGSIARSFFEEVLRKLDVI